MNWLLKIVEGPMKGAEIALVAGTRVTLGKGDDCDIIIADASLSDEAFSLDISERGVTMVRGDGSGVTLRPFEVHAFGTTAIAVGPAEGTWEELRPAPTEEASEPADGESAPSPEESAPADTAAEAEAAPAAEAAETPSAPSPRKRGKLVFLLFLLLLSVGVAALWFLWPTVAKKYPKAERARVVFVAKGKNLYGVSKVWVCDLVSKKGTAKSALPVTPPQISLAKLAAEHGLAYAQTNGFSLIYGNLERRTERHAIRALALSIDRYCHFNLSDDESFRSAAEALVFTVTEEAVKVTAAAKRKVSIAGYAPHSIALRTLEEAMRADIPWLESIDSAQVRVGGAVPVGLQKSRFATTGCLTAPEKNVAIVKETATVKESNEKKTSPKLNYENGAQLPKSFLPVAGILTKPYPCVVLIDGHRLVEGAKIGDLEILAIGSDRLTLGFGDIKVWWKP